MDHQAASGDSGDQHFADALAAALRLAGGQDVSFACAFDDALEHFGPALLLDVAVESLRHQLAYDIETPNGKATPMDWFVGTGDWTPLLRPVRDHQVTKLVARVADMGDDYREGRNYRQAIEKIEGGGVMRRQHGEFGTAEEVDAYYDGIVQMLKSARRFGILQRPPASLDQPPEVGVVRPAWLELSERNIGIGIDADGSLVRVGPGKHRLATAIALGLPSVPCELRLVHRKWLEKAIVGAADPLLALELAIKRFKAEQGVLVESAQVPIEDKTAEDLQAAWDDARGVRQKFFFAREGVPPHVGASLLTRADRGGLRGVLDAPSAMFLCRSKWQERVASLSPPEVDEEAGQPPWSADVPRIAIGADGEIYLLAPERPLPESFACEVSLIHVRHIRRSRRPEDRTVWNTIARIASNIAGQADSSAHGSIQGASP